tara:strand:- start:7681 stop:7893 length:213 start_codon:yes stop_codon:yes gene_type:complete
MDPLIADLNRYLDECDASIDEQEAAELQLYRDRLDWATRVVANESLTLTEKARRIVAGIEEEVEEALNGA